MAIEHVIVYVQGTHRFQGGLSIDRFATGLSQALGAGYRPGANVERFTFQGREIVGRVIEKDAGGGAFEPSLRLVECDYYDIFEEIEEMTLIGRATRTIKTVLPKLPLAINIFRFSGKSEGRLQGLYLFMLLFTTVLAPIVLIGAILFLVHDLADAIAKLAAAPPPPSAAGAPPPAPAPAASHVGIAAYIAGIISLLAVMKILWGAFVGKSWRAFFGMFARDPLCMLEFLTREGGRGGIASRVVSRVDKAIGFAQQHHPSAKIHVVAYSFGTIVTYDWLFPRTDDAPLAAQRNINTFVALGFPVRMVTTFWRRYYEDARDFTSMPLQRFINCFVGQDLVGTKVPDDSSMKTELVKTSGRFAEFADTLPASYQRIDQFSQGLRNMGLKVWDGIRAHSSYFGFREDFSSPAFGRVAEAIRTAP